MAASVHSSVGASPAKSTCIEREFFDKTPEQQNIIFAATPHAAQCRVADLILRKCAVTGLRGAALSRALVTSGAPGSQV